MKQLKQDIRFVLDNTNWVQHKLNVGFSWNLEDLVTNVLDNEMWKIIPHIKRSLRDNQSS